MAAIYLYNVVLNDLWPGKPIDGIPMPSLEDMQKFSYTEDWKLGTKIQLYDPTYKGYATFAYMRFMKHASEDVDLAVGGVCGMQAAGTYTFDVNNNGDNVLVQGPLAVSLFALDYGVNFTTAGKTYAYGWFWVGGVCPAGLFTDLASLHPTVSGAISAGQGMKIVDSAGAQALWVVTAAADLAPAAAFLKVAAA